MTALRMVIVAVAVVGVGAVALPVAIGPERSPAVAANTTTTATTTLSVETTVAPDPGCLTGVAVSATGDLVTSAGGPPGDGIAYSVQVEVGLPVDLDCFSKAVDAILNDQRSWNEDWHLVADEPTFTVVLASPRTVDALCRPLRTGGLLSCASGDRAILNFLRWAYGAATYGTEIDRYRTYLVNHEVGHLLGHDHVACPGEGEPAPVMMQQTKGLDSCIAQPWPLESERN